MIYRLSSYMAPKKKSAQFRGNLKFEITVRGSMRILIRDILHAIKYRIESAQETEAFINILEDRRLLTSVFHIHARRVTILETAAIKKAAEQIFKQLHAPAYFHSKGIVV